ncbi:alkaline phosphatase family protein [Paractinoplanes atraurantiacus]|uniref:Uncharacterized protein n=1 Tax=Paractinoplanes atraurantiacus TaxID=1036182 RepID=A0A285JUQ2_9ACTN|nr:alkaline phosphatase family protein [Actinoplanes atraurantiacus]SNY64015.1 hypothetical protein SAMN05421748_12622 [Actinoplanes atraurantiacus]
MLQFHAETHPSQPNCLALFSGSVRGVTGNACPHDLGARPNLARQLLDSGRTFAGYSEDLPRTGFRDARPRVTSTGTLRPAAHPPAAVRTAAARRSSGLPDIWR